MANFIPWKQVVDDANIVEVVNEYVPLKKKGNSFWGICPFHNDSNPSMSVSNNVRMYNCFSCGAKGNVISFVSRFENITESEACIKLAKKLGIKVDNTLFKKSEKESRLIGLMNEARDFYHFYLKNSEEGVEALDYLKKRNINEEIIDEFKIGLSPKINSGLTQFLINKGYNELDIQEVGLVQSSNDKVFDVFRNRIMFPIVSLYGTVGFSGRIYQKSDQSKYVNSVDNAIFHKKEVLYNINNAQLEARKENRIYLFEGFMDVIAAHKAGIKNGVATMGTALTKEHIKVLQNLTSNIVLCFDGDNAGIQAMNRSARLLAEYNIIPDAVVLPNNMDPDEYLNEYGKESLHSYLISKAKPVYHWLYHLSLQQLNKEDVKSVDNFKNNVFEFIVYSNQSTIKEYYLKLLANELSYSIEVINNDYNKYIQKVSQNKPSSNTSSNVGGKTIDSAYDYSSYESSFVNQVPSDYSLPNYHTNQDTKSSVTNENNIVAPIKKQIKTKVIKAFKIIIKHLVNNTTKMRQVLSKWQFKYYDEIGTECHILLKFRELTLEKPLSIDEDLSKKDVIEYLTKNDSSGEIKEYLDKVLSDKLIDITIEEEFAECVEVICKFCIKYKYDDSKERFENGEKAQYHNFIDLKKKI